MAHSMAASLPVPLWGDLVGTVFRYLARTSAADALKKAYTVHKQQCKDNLDSTQCNSTATQLQQYEQQIRRLLVEQKTAADAQAEAVASTRIETTQRCLREILRVVDAIDALDSQLRTKDSHHDTASSLNKKLHTVRENVQATRSLVDNILGSLGAQRIEPRRFDVFDSKLHNAIRVIEDPSMPSNVVHETLRSGLAHMGVVIRPAQVVINDVY